MKKLYLGSSSQRRRELLAATGLTFEIARPDIDEAVHPGEAADVYVQRLSREKSAAVPVIGDALVLTADTTVNYQTEIFGKPASREEAIAMLMQLRDKIHLVHTGVSLRDSVTGEITTTLTTTQVLIRPYTDEEVIAYIDSGDPFDKAGGYAIQNVGFRPVEKYIGCKSNVIGLPMCAVCAMLRARGVEVPNAPTCSAENQPCLYEVSLPS